MSLTARDIRVRYGRADVLHGIGAEMAAGRVTCIVGPNGSGKTTFLKALTGDVPFSGAVGINGEDIAGLRPWDLARRRGVLPQATRLAFPFTVIEVVRLGLVDPGLARRGTIPHEALAAVGLAGFEGRFYQELSGGEQQRVQLARVLTQVWEPVGADGPRWLFLDEPVSTLDIGQQLQVMRLARGYADAGGGVVAVMHDLNLTAMFADRVILFRSGRKRAEGSAAEVLRDDLLSEVYGCPVATNRTPPPGMPYLLPQAMAAGSAVSGG
ncbi:heme ABC transporter ATP-binding protein [Rhodobacterales bacterium HKCCE2091]|nr:heme ABC transporter ATP-binding protein [Rhodobacterales bacterium HKCCE2091]